LDKIEAQRRKTAEGSPKGEQSESIYKINRQKFHRITGLAGFTGMVDSGTPELTGSNDRLSQACLKMSSFSRLIRTANATMPIHHFL
jgi:hypothetical protein